MPEKHSPYFDFLEACKKDACPICYLVQDEEQKYIKSILYEEVNNVFFRANLRKANGFCNLHAHRLTEFKDPLGVAIIHRELIDTKIKGLGSRGVFDVLKKRSVKICMVCKLNRNVESRFIRLIIEHEAHDEFKSSFTSSKGLCLPHYERLFQKRFGRVPAWLKEFQNSSYRSFMEQLEKFISSYNATLGKNKPVLKDGEKIIWKKAVSLLYGYPGKKK